MDKIRISLNTSIFDALRAINDSTIATVVVCENGLVQGILTDGDLRRAILAGASLDEPIKNYYTKDYISVSPNTTRGDVLELMQAQTIGQIPILDAAGRLLGIHTLHSILGAEVKPNWAVIMAGGKGSRLGKLTVDTPKPMLKVAGKPILERLILHLISYGIRHIYLSVNYLSEVIENYFGDGSNWGCKISYLYEDEPLGSGGALSLLPCVPEHPVIVMNGDLLIEVDISKMLQFHQAGESYATMGVHYYSHEVPFGCVVTDDKRITMLEEKPVLTKIINAGVYIFSPDALKTVPKQRFFPVTTLFEQALDLGKPCGAYPLEGSWIDIGTPSQLKKANGL